MRARTPTGVICDRFRLQGLSCSQHGPSAIDGQIDAGDLAGDRGGEKQAGVRDILIGRDAAERVFAGVMLDRRTRRNRTRADQTRRAISDD